MENRPPSDEETPQTPSGSPVTQEGAGSGDATTPGRTAEQWKTSVGHTLFTLAGFTFFLFEWVFLSLYFDGTLWFGTDLAVWGIPVILILLVVAHLLLTLIESKRACKIVMPIWKGKPPVCYRRWLALDDSGITYGVKHVRWEVIDDLELSLMGNLVFRSRALCGNGQDQADVILKIPYAAGNQAEKNELIERVRRKKPSVVLNKRLEKSVSSPVVKGQAVIQLVTSAIMIVVLLDVGFSSFYYLELLKNYYQAGLCAMAARGDIYNIEIDPTSKADANNIVAEAQKRDSAENMKLARSAFERAQYMTAHPFPLSWVSFKFLHFSNVAAGIHQERSNVLWLLGDKQKAIAEAREALIQQPKNLRMQLRLARLLAESGQRDEAYKQLDQIFEDHESSLLPRLYWLALKRETSTAAQMKKFYREQLDACYAKTFGIEPWWPPGGDRFFTELWFSHDQRFLLDRFLQADSHPKERSKE